MPLSSRSSTRPRRGGRGNRAANWLATPHIMFQPAPAVVAGGNFAGGVGLAGLHAQVSTRPRRDGRGQRCTMSISTTSSARLKFQPTPAAMAGGNSGCPGTQTRGNCCFNPPPPRWLGQLVDEVVVPGGRVVSTRPRRGGRGQPSSTYNQYPFTIKFQPAPPCWPGATAQEDLVVEYVGLVSTRPAVVAGGSGDGELGRDEVVGVSTRPRRGGRGQGPSWMCPC